VTDAAWVLRAHESVHDRLDDLAAAAISDDLWSTAVDLLHRVMDDPDSCRTQAIRWPGSKVSGYRVTARCGRFDVHAWWSMVEGESYVWGVTFDPPLDD
jgi:hypothetical protein